MNERTPDVKMPNFLLSSSALLFLPKMVLVVSLRCATAASAATKDVLVVLTCNYSPCLLAWSFVVDDVVDDDGDVKM